MSATGISLVCLSVCVCLNVCVDAHYTAHLHTKTGKSHVLFKIKDRLRAFQEDFSLRITIALMMST